MLAAMYGHIAIVNFVLNKCGPVDLTPLDAKGVSSLLHAVTLGDVPLVQTLLGVEAVPSTIPEPDYGGRTALVQATFRNDLVIMEELLASGDVDVNAFMPNGMTAAMTAAAKGLAAALRMLLKVPGIRVNMTDTSGYSAFMHAVINNQLSTVFVLAENATTNVNLPDLRGCTPLMQVRDVQKATTNDHMLILKLTKMQFELWWTVVSPSPLPFLPVRCFRHVPPATSTSSSNC